MLLGAIFDCNIKSNNRAQVAVFGQKSAFGFEPNPRWGD
jgi:hypothetical protein